MILKFTKFLEKGISRYPFLAKLYNLYYDSTVRSEIRAARICEYNNVLCIGGGAVPSTALILAKRTKARIDIIDIDIEAIEKAKSLIKKVGLDHQIKVKLRDGSKINARKYDVIHIASQVVPKEKVIKNIVKSVECGTVILIRQPQARLKRFYSQYSNSCLKGCRIKENTCKEKLRLNTMKGTLVLVKN